MLRQSAEFPMSNGPVPIESRALGTLSYIRASIESASSLAVPGSAGIAMGCVGVAAAGLASLPVFAANWLQIWLVAAIAAVNFGGTLMFRQAVRGKTLYYGPLRKFLLCLSPPLLTGAALTLVLWQAHLERLIPGSWLLLYGCAVLASSTVTAAATFRLAASMGAIFIVLGLVAFVVPPSFHTLLLGVGFGALHLIFGLLIGRANHDR